MQNVIISRQWGFSKSYSIIKSINDRVRNCNRIMSSCHSQRLYISTIKPKRAIVKPSDKALNIFLADFRNSRNFL